MHGKEIVEAAAAFDAFAHIVRIGGPFRRIEVGGGESGADDGDSGNGFPQYRRGDLQQLQILLRREIGEADEVGFVPDLREPEAGAVVFGDFPHIFLPEPVVGATAAGTAALHRLTVVRRDRPGGEIEKDGGEFDLIFPQKFCNVIIGAEGPLAVPRLNPV